MVNFSKVSVQMQSYCYLVQQCGTKRHFSYNNEHLTHAAADCTRKPLTAGNRHSDVFYVSPAHINKGSKNYTERKRGDWFLLLCSGASTCWICSVLKWQSTNNLPQWMNSGCTVFMFNVTTAVRVHLEHVQTQRDTHTDTRTHLCICHRHVHKCISCPSPGDHWVGSSAPCDPN